MKLTPVWITGTRTTVSFQRSVDEIISNMKVRVSLHVIFPKVEHKAYIAALPRLQDE